MTVIYYEYERILGVNSTHKDDKGEFQYNYFSSLTKFNQWISWEMSNSKTVEITNKNYADLHRRGLI